MRLPSRASIQVNGFPFDFAKNPGQVVELVIDLQAARAPARIAAKFIVSPSVRYFGPGTAAEQLNALVAGIVILVAVTRLAPAERLLRLCLGLIWTGAIGNLIDRFSRGTVFIAASTRTRWPALKTTLVDQQSTITSQG